MSARFRRALWIALVVNMAMLLVEVIAGVAAESVSLWADALDFAGDSANYALSLAVLSMAPATRSWAALAKGASMAAFGAFVLASAFWSATRGEPPQALTMGVVGFIALLANAGVAVVLYAFREGDANMRSVWLCSRNDAFANIAVMLAALGVFGTGSVLPDVLVALVIAGLALSSGVRVLRHARAELRNSPALLN